MSEVIQLTSSIFIFSLIALLASVSIAQEEATNPD